MPTPPQHPLSGFCIGISLTNGFERAEMTKPRAALEASGAVIRRVFGTTDQVRDLHHDQPGVLFGVDTTLKQVRAAR